MKRHLGAAALSLCMGAGIAQAETFMQVTDKTDFVNLVSGKTLRYIGTSLAVKPDGKIEGRAIGYPITGQWRWEGGFFCREMDWGGTAIPANCQRVDVRGNTVKFTSDRGAGQSANLTLR